MARWKEYFDPDDGDYDAESEVGLIKEIEQFIAKRLKRTPLPSMTGFEARAPISPRPSTAVPLEITATRFPFVV